ncbi:MAG: Tryptophan synthase alpha chain [Myxococcaceae bacterium]|nr:Tryptophan synthase alpha chain [Myxococcaceae bacterium]
MENVSRAAGRSNVVRLVVALVGFVALVGCAADPVLLPDASTADTGAQVCTPGAQVACTCVGGATGAQVCASDGRSLGACGCPDAGALEDVGGADVGGDRPASVDLGAPDVGTDAGQLADVLRVDVSDDRPAPMDAAAGDDAPDAGQLADAGADRADAPLDALPDACTSTTAGNCCGLECSARNAVAACLGGACGFTSCHANFGDCDGDRANGCETDTRADRLNCGACGAPCVAGRVCMAGACRDCSGGRTFCGGACVDTGFDPANCGACGTTCPTPAPHTVGTCNARVCGTTCAAGWGDCDSSRTNGCEANLTSRANCGGCGRGCPEPFTCNGVSCTDL